MNALSDKAKQSDYKARQREKGLAYVTVWVPEIDRQKLIEYARELRKKRGID